MGDELQFDVVMPDTKLAVDFLKENKVFKSSITVEAYDEKIYYIENTQYFVYQITDDAECPLIDIKPTCNELHKNEGFVKLNRLIDENKDLIIQLEYLVRHISVEETQFNLKLIQSYADRWQTCEELDYTLYLYFDGNTPLSCIATAIESEEFGTVILCTKDAAPLVKILTNFLRECGYGVEMVLVENLNSTAWVGALGATGEKSEFASGCVGVVTETADVDAAVDVFLASFVQNPWKIQRILVQENVYDSLKNALQWKWERQSRTNEETNKIGQELQSKCTAVYEFKDKAFVLDYADTNISQGMEQVTFIEAYRTNQELLMLLKNHSSFSITIWCNDVSVANKIAHESRISLVWINDYGFFRGCSNVFFNKLWISSLPDIPNEVADLEINAWLKFDKEQRKSRISQKVTELLGNSGEKVKKVLYLFESLADDSKTNDNQVWVDNSGQSVVINTPQPLIIFSRLSDSDCVRVAKAMALCLEGNTVIFDWDLNICSDSDIKRFENDYIADTPLYKCKAIYTRLS